MGVEIRGRCPRNERGHRFNVNTFHDWYMYRCLLEETGVFHPNEIKAMRYNDDKGRATAEQAKEAAERLRKTEAYSEGVRYFKEGRVNSILTDLDVKEFVAFLE